ARTPDASEGMLVQRAGLPSGHVCRLGRLPVTTPARTAADLGRLGSLRAAVVAADSALRAGATCAELRRVVAAQRGWPGVRTVDCALRLADVGSESPLESLAHVAQAEA